MLVCNACLMEGDSSKKAIVRSGGHKTIALSGNGAGAVHQKPNLAPLGTYPHHDKSTLTIWQVLSTDGDAELGGDDFTRALAGLALLKARQESSTGASAGSHSSSMLGASSSPCGDAGDSHNGATGGPRASSPLLSSLTPSQRLAVLSAAEEAKQRLGSSGGSGSSGRNSGSVQEVCMAVPHEVAAGQQGQVRMMRRSGQRGWLLGSEARCG